MLKHAVRLVRGPGSPKRFTSTLAAVVLLVLASLPASAATMGGGFTLDDLVRGGAELLSASNQLSFSNFEVEITGGSQDLTQYAVTQLDDGFKIAGEQGRQPEPLEIILRYDVATRDERLVLQAMGLSSSRWNRYGMNEASVKEYDEAGALVLDESRRIKDRRLAEEYWDFSESMKESSVVESIQISSFIVGDSWNLRRRFQTSSIEPVPEPGTALLLGMGMVGIATRTRRSRRLRVRG